MKFYGVDLTVAERERSLPDVLRTSAVADLLEAISDGIALVSLDGGIHSANRAFATIFGFSSIEATGQNLSSFALRGGVLATLGASLRRARPHDVTGLVGTDRTMVASLRILHDEDGGAYGGLIILRDLAGPRNQRPERFRFQGDGRDSRPVFVDTPYLDDLLRQGASALRRNARVILTGESGTGKTELARRLRDRSFAGTGAPFVHVNCGGIPESLFESEMFGYDAGAFTGAASRGKIGYVEAADGGVLFLDEVGEIPLHVQAKLLTFLEDGTYLRVGSAMHRRVHVNVISATNRSLPQMIGEGRFRRDLYYRLAVVTLHLPPLRGQTTLIGHLIDNHLLHINTERCPALALSPAFRAALLDHCYPGNIRELANILEHAAAAAEGIADLEHLPEELSAVAPEASSSKATEAGLVEAGDIPLKDMMRSFEDFVLEKAIAKHGSKRRAAKALGIDIGTIVRKTRRE